MVSTPCLRDHVKRPRLQSTGPVRCRRVVSRFAGRGALVNLSDQPRPRPDLHRPEPRSSTRRDRPQSRHRRTRRRTPARVFVPYLVKGYLTWPEYVVECPPVIASDLQRPAFDCAFDAPSAPFPPSPTARRNCCDQGFGGGCCVVDPVESTHSCAIRFPCRAFHTPLQSREWRERSTILTSVSWFQATWEYRWRSSRMISLVWWSASFSASIAPGEPRMPFTTSCSRRSLLRADSSSGQLAWR